MAVAVANYWSGTASGSTSVSVSVSGITAGNLLLAIVGKDDDSIPTGVPTGWTLVDSSTSGNAHAVAVYYKEAVTADESATSYQWSGDREDWYVHLYELSGQDAGTDWQCSADPVRFASGSTSASSTTHNSSCINWSTGTICIAGVFYDGDETPITNNNSGWTTRWNGATAGGNNGVSGVCLDQANTSGSTTWVADANDEWISYRILVYPTAGTTTNKTVTGSSTPSGDLTAKALKDLTGTITGTGAQSRKTSVTRTGTITGAGALLKLISKAVAGSLTGSGALATTKVVMKSVAGSLTGAGALVRDIGKAVAGDITGSGQIIRDILVTRSGSISGVGLVTKDIAKLFSRFLYMYSGKTGPELVPDPGMDNSGDWTLTGGASITAGRMELTTLSASGIPSPAITYTIGKRYAYSFEVQDLSPLLGGAIYIAAVEVWNYQDGLGLHNGEGKFSGTVVGQIPSGAAPFEISSSGGPWYVDNYSVKLVNPIQVQVQKLLQGAVTLVGGLYQQVGKRLAGAITGAGAISRAIAKGLSGAVTATGALLKRIPQLVAGSITAVGSGVGQIAQAATAKLVLFRGAIFRDTDTSLVLFRGRIYRGTASVQGTTFQQAVAGAITAAGSMASTLGKLLQGTITATGSILKSIAKSVVGNITATGALIKRAAKELSGVLQPRGISFLSEEQIVDPSFDNASEWIAGTGWTVTGGQAVASAAASQLLSNNDVQFPLGTLVEVETVVSSWTSATFLYPLINSIAVTPISVIQGVGTYRQYHLVETSNNGVNGLVTFSGTFAIDSFSVKKATPLKKLIYIATEGSMTAAGALSTIKVFLQAVAASITATGALIKRTGKQVAGSVTGSGSLARRVGKLLSGSVTGSGSLARRVGKLLSGSITGSGVLTSIKVFLEAVGGSITAAGAVAGRVGKSLVGSITGSGSLVKQIGKQVAGTVTAAGALFKSVYVSIAGSITGSGALTSIKVFLEAVGGSITATGALFKRSGAAVAGSITGSGVVRKLTSIDLAGAITSTGALLKLIYISAAGAITGSGAVSTLKVFLQALAGSITAAGSLLREKILGTIQQAVGGSITAVGSITKQTARSIAGSISAAGTVLKQTALALAGSITGSGSAVGLRAILRTIAGSITPVGAVTKGVLKSLAGAITGSGTIAKRIGKKIIGTIIAAGQAVGSFISQFFYENVYNTMTIVMVEQTMNITVSHTATVTLAEPTMDITEENRTATIVYSQTTD